MKSRAWTTICITFCMINLLKSVELDDHKISCGREKTPTVHDISLLSQGQFFMLQQESGRGRKRGKRCEDSLNVTQAFIRNLVYSAWKLNNGTIASADCQDHWYTNKKAFQKVKKCTEVLKSLLCIKSTKFQETCYSTLVLYNQI